MANRWQAKRQRKKDKKASLNAENFEELNCHTAESSSAADDKQDSSNMEGEFLLANTQTLQTNDYAVNTADNFDGVAPKGDDFAVSLNESCAEKNYNDNSSVDNASVEADIVQAGIAVQDQDAKIEDAENIAVIAVDGANNMESVITPEAAKDVADSEEEIITSEAAKDVAVSTEGVANSAEEVVTSEEVISTDTSDNAELQEAEASAAAALVTDGDNSPEDAVAEESDIAAAESIADVDNPITLEEKLPEVIAESQESDGVDTANKSDSDSAAEVSRKEGEHDFVSNIDYSALGLDFLEDDGVVAVHNGGVHKSETVAADDNNPDKVNAEDKPTEADAFTMDDEYLKAFMEEGSADDFIYAPNTVIKESILDKIADNAEDLAEEGTKVLENKEQEKALEPEELLNENGERIDKKGRIILKRTLENKLCLAETRERRYYNTLKNELLSYIGVKDSLTQQADTFKIGRATIARLTITGNCNRLYLALDPMEYDIERYKQSDVKVPDFDNTLMMVKINDDDSYAIAIELLTLMMGQRVVDKQTGYQPVDFLPQYPRRTDAVLDEKGKLLAGEAADEKALEKERRALEKKANAAVSSTEKDKEEQETQKEEEVLTILPLTMENKLHQTVNSIKKYYSKLKNELLSYKKIKSNMTQTADNFKAGKDILAKMVVVANNLRLYLALNPEDYKDAKYHQRNVKDQKGYEDTPLMVKVSNDKDYKNAVALIKGLVKKHELERNKRYVYEPYAEKYPYIKNAVFKGDEGKPLPDLKSEEYVDVYGELTEHLRSQYGEVDAWGVPKGYTAEDGLSARELMELHRQKAKTLNAGVALATPIVFFYDVAINSANEPQYVNVQQVLNDKFLGKIIPQHFFAIAEGSNRIEELNFIALENVRKDCEENPNIKFVVKISCRLLLHDNTLTKLIENIMTTNKNLILAFDCAMLEAIGYLGVSGINALKNKGALIMLDNAESASMRVLTEYEFDYLRLDARYYGNDSARRLAHLDMLTGYAAMQNILSTSINCEHPEDARVLLDHGVKIIQGDAVSRPMRLIGLALKNVKAIPKVRKNG